ncbi:CDF family Co(II)/Ni(II) efflux transporter DmeF [Burkholderia metallica]|uniref:CDF family Co(II)/Ni(II) efflux transporter DmeF n=1 Tax=Burkholderia metallica TaxID=488729 RepID=UPI00157AC0F9|nr:CDF family Co(II)/Ni(II) efflux transporter DmeF [Burkholderia metallica]NTZ87516.1 CDF family Co(II)/Ni(II) efflux transporter DmeF [Burkholderia metallica]
MNELNGTSAGGVHSHAFLGAAHARNERKTWMVIGLCTAMMIAEIVGGTLFGSLALVADGLHMSTHAGAMLIAALAYTYARRYADDPRFVFGTGKLGDLAGFTSAIVLAMIALLIGYEAIARLLAPVPIHFDEAIPIAVLGLAVNLASVWLLSGDHHHGHGHGHHHAHGHDHHHEDDHDDAHHAHHGHGSHSAAHRDHNIRSAYVHVIADAAVSVLAIVGLLLARAFGWVWMDPLAGIVGALVIANWAYGLIRDTGGVLLDVNVDRKLTDNVRRAIEALGDTVNDLHVWRVGPGHMSAIVSVESGDTARDARFYHALVAGFDGVSHVTVEVLTPAKAA